MLCPTKKLPIAAVSGELNRRDALVKAGVVGGRRGCGRFASRARPRPPSARRRRSRRPKVKYGGRLIWALEQDPVHVAPFGAILTSNHWGKQAAVRLARRVGQEPEPQAGARRRRGRSSADQKSITFNLRKGVKFHNGKELDAGDVKYSVEQMLNPPLPGSISTVGQVPAFLGVDVVSKYVARLSLKAPRRACLRVPRLGSLLADRARRSLRARSTSAATRSAPARTGWSASTRTTASSTWPTRTSGRRASRTWTRSR